MQIFHHKSTNETPDCSDGSRIESTIQVIRSNTHCLFWCLFGRCRREEVYLNRARERKKDFYQAANIYKTGGKYQAKRYSFLGCHTITVSKTLSFQARKSCSFSLRREVLLLLTCHSSACVLTEKGQRSPIFQASFTWSFPEFFRGCLWEATSRLCDRASILQWICHSDGIRHLQRERERDSESLCLCFRVRIKTLYSSAQMFTQTRNNRKTTMWLSSVWGKKGDTRKGIKITNALRNKITLHITFFK